ncbi:MAG: type II toxin-antitoxin system RelE/ParE family toxin [Arenicellales bacterium]|jgi:phage-related protein
MKRISFVDRSLNDLKQFPEDARREAGYQLDKVQRGIEPTDWKPMKMVGAGVTEIRIKDDQGIYRVIYISKYANTVFVLHAFKKKSQKTAKKDLEIARKRLKVVIQEVQ